jgi:Icc protein
MSAVRHRTPGETKVFSPGAGVRDRAHAYAPMIRLVQISDTHLFADPDGRLLGQRTRRSCEAVLALLRATLLPVDAVLLTGDLVHDERPEGYLYLREALHTLGVTYYAIPGNHDLAARLAGHLDPAAAQPVRSVRIGDWHLVLLDSTLPGEDGGRLGTSRLAGLDLALAACPESPALICLHHQPIPVGSQWMDAIGLEDGDAFFAVMDRHPQVRGVLWGHIHQAFDGCRADVRLMGSPSTAVQFLPCSQDLALDSAAPGLRWLELNPDGHLETGIARLADYHYQDPIDLSQTGY